MYNAWGVTKLGITNKTIKKYDKYEYIVKSIKSS